MIILIEKAGGLRFNVRKRRLDMLGTLRFQLRKDSECRRKCSQNGTTALR